MISPQLASLYQNAQDALNRRDFVAAESIATHILAQHRNDIQAQLFLVHAARSTWQLARAVEIQTRIVQQQPKHAGLRIDLGNLFIEVGRLDRAVAQFDRALKLEPSSLAALSGKGTVYSMQNKYERLRRLLKPHLATDGPEPQIAWLCLHVLNRTGDHDEAIARGERVVETHTTPSMPLRTTWFELARAYERTDRYDDAFAAATHGNALMRVPFDVDACIDQNTRIIETFSADRLATLPRPAAPSELPVFIVGIPRCGSTLTERIIHAHPLAHGAGEHIAMFKLVQELPASLESTAPYPECVPELTPSDVETLSRTYLDTMTQLAPRATRVSNKDLASFLHLGLINVLFPNARVIHCRRNPVDTCLSCFMEPLAPASSPYAYDLEVLGRYYRDYERLMAHWRTVLDVPVLEVDYESLISDQEAVTREIVEFCGLPWDDACLRFHESARVERTLSLEQVRKPLYATSIGRADRFGAALDPLRSALSGDASAASETP